MRFVGGKKYMHVMKSALLSIIFSFVFTGRAETSLLPTHDGKTLNVYWNLRIEELKENGAILTSEKYNIYEYDNLLLFQFTSGSKLKKVSIRYSGESTGFCERTFEKMLKYYYDQGIPCKVEYYRKIGMMSSMMIWFEVPGNIFVVLEHLIIQLSESKISSVFIHACNSQYYSKANIVKGYKRTD